jgi:hypothetical protein
MTPSYGLAFATEWQPKWNFKSSKYPAPGLAALFFTVPPFPHLTRQKMAMPLTLINLTIFSLKARPPSADVCI